ncbi:hypothetical protein RRG08_008381 [Elysia crispata]|uniref:Uncharacterized protein n=1 Tax=Elysia crispata TaxID=231223 RepID=A0AAE1AZA7_9GAST|nr:hypothetical protein RRG08_008381 [Elysia crispata]
MIESKKKNSKWGREGPGGAKASLTITGEDGGEIGWEDASPTGRRDKSANTKHSSVRKEAQKIVVEITGSKNR